LIFKDLSIVSEFTTFIAQKYVFNKSIISHISTIMIEPSSATMSLNNEIEHLHVSANDEHHQKAANISKECFTYILCACN
jgi:hypothetical protein